MYNNESDASSALDSIKQRTALKVEFCDERTLGHQKSYKKTAAEMNPFLYINSNDTALSAKEVEKYMSNYAGSIGIEYLDSRSQTFTPQSPQASAAQFSAKILFKDATSAEFALADLTNMTNIIATNYFVVQSRDSSSSSSDRSASPSGGHRDEMKRYQPPPAKLKHKGGGEDDRRSQSPSISSRQQPTPPPPSHQNYSHQDSREGRGGGDNQHQHHYNNQDSSYNSARRGRRDDSGTRRGSRGENNNRRQQQQRSKPEDLDNLETASLNSSGSRFTATGGRDVSSKPMRTMFIAGLRNDEKVIVY